MTTYEKADLFRALVDSATNSMMGYISVLFAFLIAAYLVAPHFNRIMSCIVVGLFTMFSAVMIIAIDRSLASLSGLAEEIRKSAAAGDTTISWHPIVHEPTTWVSLIGPFLTSLLFAGTIAGIFFFIYARKRTVGNGLLPTAH
jgi:hypothetical protein